MQSNEGARMSSEMRFLLFYVAAKSLLVSWIFSVQINEKRSLRRFQIQKHQQKITSEVWISNVFIN